MVLNRSSVVENAITMTTYNGAFNPSLNRYNARKKELQNSMLEYSEHVRTLNSMKDGSLKGNTSPSLEIQARRQNILRRSDPAMHNVKRLTRTNSKLRQRPLSLDEKELLRNKELNQNLVAASRRDTKSEYRRPAPNISLSIPTASGPPNTPDTNRSNNVKVSFVSASDLYDIVEFRNNVKPPTKSTARVSSVEDGVKLIEQIDLRTRQERKTAWGKTKDNCDYFYNSFQIKDTQNTKSGDNNILGGVLTGKSIVSELKTRKKVNSNVAIPSPRENNSKKSVRFTDVTTLPVIKSEKDEIYPLNIFLETVVSSHTDSLNTLRQRPKRAKRMKLHRPELVVIPEDGDSHSSSMNPESFDKLSVQGQGTPYPSRASLSAIKEGNAHKKRGMIHPGSKDDSTNHNSSSSNSSSDNTCITAVSDGHRKDKQYTVKQKKKKKKGQIKESTHLLDTILENSSSIYPTLPWEIESDSDDTDFLTKPIDLEQTSSGGHRKVKRLVFLTDQSEDAYRHRV